MSVYFTTFAVKCWGDYARRAFNGGTGISGQRQIDVIICFGGSLRRKQRLLEDRPTEEALPCCALAVAVHDNAGCDVCLNAAGLGTPSTTSFAVAWGVAVDIKSVLRHSEQNIRALSLCRVSGTPPLFVTAWILLIPSTDSETRPAAGVTVAFWIDPHNTVRL